MLLSTLVLASALALSAGEYDNVIHPGKPDGTDFWNARAVWFMYAPAFGFSRVDGARSYRFTVTDAQGGVRTFTAAEPTAPLSPVWRAVPVGDATVVCEGLGADGKILGKAGTRAFLKVAGFRGDGAYPPPVRPFRETACGIYAYAFGKKDIRHLLDTGRLDMSDPINSYASKACGGLISAMVRYAAIDPSKRDRALEIARKAADYLIAGAEKADAPLAYFPQTYDGPGEGKTGLKNKGLIMLSYPATAASSILELYEATGEARWLDYAEKVAATYLKLQGADGTWPLKMRASDGKIVNPNRLVPVQNALPFFERLFRLTKKPAYRAAADRAFACVERTRLADWNWEGQFEDVPPTGKYVNLTKHDAVSTAILLLERFPDDPARRRQARELMRFAEDQFVCWERPAGGGPVRNLGGWHPSTRYDEWHTPCALEQYNCYWPIDASAAKIIRGYLALYRAEGDPVDLAKARTLGATMTRLQRKDGSLPTWWWTVRGGNDWLNCMFGSARALLELAEFNRLTDFRVRDPFVVNAGGARPYLLFMSDSWRKTGRGSKEWCAPGIQTVSFSRSADLVHWSDPETCMTAPDWCGAIWAPEIHRWKDKWYMFVTLKERAGYGEPIRSMVPGEPDWEHCRGARTNSTCHAVWIYRADRPEGPYRPIADRPLTAKGYISLDGTLGVEDGKPWMVYTHDWAQIRIGTYELRPLADDLTHFTGPAKTLFTAAEMPLCQGAGVTDGAFLYRSPKSGKLFMTWSTHDPRHPSGRGYCVVLCESATGRLAGPWVNHHYISSDASGHGQFFRATDGRPLFAMHRECPTSEYTRIFEVIDDGDTLTFGRELGGAAKDR